MRRFVLLLLVTAAACEMSESPTEPPHESAPATPRFSFTGGSGTVLASTNAGELVEIDLDAGTVTLIGDAGTVGGDELGWTDIALDGSGHLYALSRYITESDGVAHLYTIDPTSGAVLHEVGSTGWIQMSDMEFLGDTIFGLGSTNYTFSSFRMDPSTAAVSFIPSDTAYVSLGDNPFDSISFPDLNTGGFAVHPTTGELWGIENQLSNAPVIYHIDRTTGAADSIMRLGLDGVPTPGFQEYPSTIAFDGLHILDDGTFIATRGGSGFPPDSILYEVSPVPDPVSGLAEIAPIPLIFASPLDGHLNGLTTAPGHVLVSIESTATSGFGGSSFVSVAPENLVSHSGAVMPSSLTPSLTWSVEVLTPRGALVAGPSGGTGATFDWTVPAQPSARYAGYTHAEAIAAISSSDPLPNALRFGVTLTATDDEGLEHASEPVVVEQDEIDAIRQEYADYMASASLPRIPARGEFSAQQPCEIVCVNNGDFAFAIVDPVFWTRLNALKAAWPGMWQLNVIYRNPVHQNLHVGSVGNSWHQYGCAADLQTFPVPRSTQTDEDAAEMFWQELARLARRSGFQVEDLSDSQVGHVHVEINCPQPLQ